jgi:hypothetical protein
MPFTSPVEHEMQHQLDFHSAVGSQFVTELERDAVLAKVVESLLNCYSAVENLNRQQADLLCDTIGNLLSVAETCCEFAPT